jgi:hypothetical protein
MVLKSIFGGLGNTSLKHLATKFHVVVDVTKGKIIKISLAIGGVIR